MQAIKNSFILAISMCVTGAVSSGSGVKDWISWGLMLRVTLSPTL